MWATRFVGVDRAVLRMFQTVRASPVALDDIGLTFLAGVMRERFLWTLAYCPQRIACSSLVASCSRHYCLQIICLGSGSAAVLPRAVTTK